MKLLLDQNLSDKIPAHIADLFPRSVQVKMVDLAEADDSVVADWAKHEGFMIVSKDADFYQRSMVFGHPPKLVWLRVGNCSTALVVALLRKQAGLIRAFGASDVESVLILERPLS